MPEHLSDDTASYEVTARTVVGEGRLHSLVRETLEYEGTQLEREFIEHSGAVAVVALDDEDRVLLIRQYRHPLRSREWELPAGLLDAVDEPRLHAAQRELVEETGMAAGEWSRLIDFAASPGGSTEVVSIFLARSLVHVASDYVREGEEADIETRWVPIADVADAALSGQLRNGPLLVGIFAALAARAGNWANLRPADSV